MISALMFAVMVSGVIYHGNHVDESWPSVPKRCEFITGFFPGEMSADAKLPKRFQYSLSSRLLKVVSAVVFKLTFEECVDLFEQDVIEIAGYRERYLKIRGTCFVLGFERDDLYQKIVKIYYSPMSHALPPTATSLHYKILNGSWCRLKIQYDLLWLSWKRASEKSSTVFFDDDVVVLYPFSEFPISTLYKFVTFRYYNSFSLVCPNPEDTHLMMKSAVIANKYYFLPLSKKILLVWFRPKDFLLKWDMELWFRRNGKGARNRYYESCHP